MPLTGGVLGAAALVSAPALWRGLTGTMPIDVALTRYLVSVAVVWVVLAVIVDFTLPDPHSVRVRSDDTGPDRDPEQR